MARYYFNQYDELDTIDDEGVELPDLAAAEAHAVRGIRDSSGHQVIGGRLHLNLRIEITDQAGEVQRIVRFADAVQIVG